MVEHWGDWHAGTVKAKLGGKDQLVWSLFTNDLFIVTSVQFNCEYGLCLHLVMRLKAPTILVHKRGEEMPLTLPPAAGITWAVKQRIKDELAGAGRLAIEVFPPRQELVDQADAYHLWVLPEGFKLPFGVEEWSGP